MKTYDVVAAAIEAQETGHCFALLGDGNMHFAGALAHLGMPFTYARHEHCAVSMAMAYARVTGTPRSCHGNLRPGSDAGDDRPCCCRAGAHPAGAVCW